MNETPRLSNAATDRVTSRLEGGRGGMYRCPAHDDHHASLSVAAGNNGGAVLKCFVGCETLAIVKALGLTMSDLMPPAAPTAGAGLGRIVATYDYRNENGNLLCQAVRFDPKGFRQRRPGTRDGEWEWNVKGVRPVVYRLPEVRAAIDRGEPVYVVEGEKDVDALTALGRCATCNAAGAGKWGRSHTECLLGASRVVVLSDNDDPGRAHADQVAAALSARGIPVRVLALPGLPDKGDVSDWLRAGGTREGLETLAGAATTWTAPRVEEVGTVRLPVRAECFPLTDLGNAERLIHQHGSSARYCHDWSRWLVWDGRRWKPDTDGAIERLAVQTVRSIYAEAGKADEAAMRKTLAAWARESEGRGRISAMTALAQNLPGVGIIPAAFDADPWLLNAANGTVDLRTSEITPAKRSDFITKLAPGEYTPDVESPTWDAFLERILPDSETRSYVQRAAGYSATGCIGEECIFLPYGSGRNGKSKFLGALETTLGEYSRACGAETLAAKHGDTIPNDVAALVGSRLVVTSEAAEGRRLDVQRVKQLTGGDTMSARFMRSEFFEFRFMGKIWFATNHKPVIRDTTIAIWERVKLIPFTVSIPEGERDKDLAAKLAGEVSGILRWIVEGCLLWQAYGLMEPESVRGAVQEYREEMDALGAFLADCCRLGDRERIGATQLYQCYTSWCARSNEQPITQTAFGRRLGERGFGDLKGQRHKVYTGLSIASEAEGDLTLT